MIKTRTSIITIKNNIVKKKFYNTLPKNERHRLGPRHCKCGSDIKILFQNEIDILKKLDKYDNFPKLLSFNCQDNSYTMTYCGDTLHNMKKNKKLKIPNNWEVQISNISKALTDINIYNNDISYPNICILDDIIYIIDFGCCQPLDIKLKENFDNRDNYKDLYQLFHNISNFSK